jgi:hypothetical protein
VSSRCEENQVDQNDKLRKAVAGLQETVLYNTFMADAIFELLVEKGILAGDEVKERVKKLKEEAPPQFRWLQ